MFGPNPKKWMIQAQLMPARRPTNPAYNQCNKGKSMHGSIYLEDNDTNSNVQSKVKFELIGTSVSKHNESINQYSRSANNSKTKSYQDQRKRGHAYVN